MKGRKPIPSKIVNLRGGSDHTHRPETADIGVKAELPSCPQYLGKVARKEWRRFTKEIKQLGIVGKIDRTIIAEYCREFETVLAMDELIAKAGYVKVNPKGEMQTNKAVIIRNHAVDRMMKALQELMGSPSSRARHKIEKPKQKGRADRFRERKNGAKS